MNPNAETVYAPLETLVMFLYSLRVIYFCGYFAYDGLKNGITLTHAGLKKGILARVYGVLYILISLITMIGLTGMAEDLWSVSLAEYWKALTSVYPSLSRGLVYLIIAGFMAGVVGLAFLFVKLRRNTGSKINHWNPKAHVLLYWMISFPVALCIQALLGLPGFIYVAIWIVFTFFSPLTSPRELKKILPVKDNEKSTKGVE